jgi:hypothetical protein
MKIQPILKYLDYLKGKIYKAKTLKNIEIK